MIVQIQNLAREMGSTGDFSEFSKVEKHFKGTVFGEPKMTCHKSFSVLHKPTGFYAAFDWWSDLIQFDCIHTVDEDGDFDQVLR